MPTSRPYHLTWLCNKVIELQPQSILDVGVGFGSKGMLFREYTDVWGGNMFDRKVRIDGVEIFREYITKLQKSIYDTIYIGDIREMVQKLQDYDMIYMGDVLEHISRDDGLKLVSDLRKKARDLVIVTPGKVSHQGSVYGNENESHLSQWYPTDFDGANIIEIDNSLIAHFEKPEIYYCDGMRFYGERMVKRYGFKPYSKNTQKDCLFMGLYFAEDYEVFKLHTGRKYIFWNGSDVSRLLLNKGWQEVLNDYPAKHICHNEQLRLELESVGIHALVSPLFFGDTEDYTLSFTPKHRMQVYINAHPNREDEYGVPVVYQASKRLPGMDFFVYGVTGRDTKNLKYMGWLDENIADRRMSKHHVCLRLNKHDGMSQLVIKAGLWGHYVFTTQDMPHTTRFDDVLDLVEKLKALNPKVTPGTELRQYLLSLGLNDIDWL
jgi:hypothetical protein